MDFIYRFFLVPFHRAADKRMKEGKNLEAPFSHKALISEECYISTETPNLS